MHQLYNILRISVVNIVGILQHRVNKLIYISKPLGDSHAIVGIYGKAHLVAIK